MRQYGKEAVMEQEIRFCTVADGFRIAYATAGAGAPIVKAANYLTQLEHDWNGPVCRHWLEGLTRHHMLVRYDGRGCGLSDWDVNELSIAAWVQDLETVVDAAALECFALFGIAEGAAIAIAYAVKHPHRVSQLILYGGYARGRFHRHPSAEELLQAETIINVIRIGWGQANPAFRQLFTTLLMPEGTEAQKEWLNELARISTTPETAAQIEQASCQINVADCAQRITIPTLVLHSRDDAVVPFEEGRLLATLIPDARFVALDSKNHILLEAEPAWARFLAELFTFLCVDEAEQTSIDLQERVPDLTRRELDILHLIAQGVSNDTIAEQLVITPKTVRNHVSRIYSKMQVENRAQAIVLAREAGLGQEPR
jgi:pimeloyl-ACP methyl ester carboxylesterase/DNA-binding CsgD family transcriptional regulator